MSREFTNYSQHSGTQAKQSEKILQELEEVAGKEIKSGESINTVLDAGCGDGEVTEQLYNLLKTDLGIDQLRVLGIDKTGKRLKTAKKKHSNPDISYLQADLVDSPVTYQFDVVFSNAALHWVEEQDKLYQNFANILRKDGVLAVHQGAAGSYIELHEVAVETAQEMGLGIRKPKMPPAYLEPREAEKILQKHGFKIVNMDAVEYPIEGKQIVRDFAEASLSAYFDFMADEKVEAFKKRFVENGFMYVEEGSSVAARRLYFTALRK